MNKFLFSAVLILLSTFLIADPLPISLFAKPAEYKSIKLSPDGKYFAATAPLGNKTILVVIQRTTMQAVRTFHFEDREHVDEFYWVNNERLVYTRYFTDNFAETPKSYGQIYAGNIDGTKSGTIFGYQGGTADKGSRLNKSRGSERSHGEILSILPRDPKNIIISARNMDNDLDAPMRIVKLNIYTGYKKDITRTPFGNIQLVIDEVGAPVIGYGLDSFANERMFWFKEGSWEEIGSNEELFKFQPVSVNKDRSKLYLLSRENTKVETLFEYDFATQKITSLFSHDFVDILALIKDPSDFSIIGVKLMPGLMDYFYIDKENPAARIHQSLVAAFQNDDIEITSISDDKKEMIVSVRNDKSPDSFYLFNSVTNQVSHLLSTKNWITPKLMASKTPIKFKARDGQVIHGYLTLPNNMQKEIPLVTYVHGGPFGMQDSWLFDEDAQMLANNGYAVLQVNYRGSGGYGYEFQKAGFQKMSSLIQHDIIDGTRWAMSLPEVSDSQVCIMGWSFGGYSALMSVLIEPDLFKCSIAAAGIYDMVEQNDSADYSRIDSLSSTIEREHGNNEKKLILESPLTYIDRLKTPLFIVHGGDDKRVTSDQAFLLKEALDKRKISYEWMFKKKEGHGFHNEENLTEFYQKTIAFLDRHLKGVSSNSTKGD